jgi:hypothetical protein
MDATFLKILHELDYDTLTMAQASEVMGALREAVGKGEAWFAKFSAGFVNGAKMLQPPIPDVAFLDAAPKAIQARRGGKKTLKRAQPKNVIEVPLVKRGRGRPRKVVPEVVKRGGETATRVAHNHENAGSSPAPATPDDHPPIGVLQGSYVSQTGPDPNRGYSLPPTHPRATGAVLPAAADPDFAAAEAGKVRFQ